MEDLSISSICVLRLSAIGDCVNALAVVQMLQRNFPKAEITWIIGKNESALFKGIPGITLVPYDKKSGLKGILSLRKYLKSKKFDVVLDMQSALRASLLSCLALKSKRKYGFDKVRAMDGQQFFTNIKVKSPEPPKIHVLDGFVAFAEAIGCKDLTLSWNLNLSNEEKQFALNYVKEKTIVITPSSSKEFKNWTLNGYIEICKHAIDKGFNIVIAGGPSFSEVKLSQDLANGLNKYSEKVINLTGKTTLRQLAAIISLASMLISPDSGPVHIANALNIPVLSMYANHNPKRVGPYNFLKYSVSVYEENLKIEHPEGTDKLKWRTRVKNKLAMHGITTNMVRESFDKILQDFSI